MTHVADGDLVRLMDGACEPTERTQLERHVVACVPCTTRLRALRRQSDLVSRTLAEMDRPATLAPERRWRVLRPAVAAALVLIGIGAGVEPVRAWLVQQTNALWSAVAGVRAPEAEATAAAPVQAPAAPGEASVAFVPAGDVFRLEVGAHQAGGTLVIETAAGDTARATVLGGSEHENLLVLPSGLRIVNGASSSATYRITLPARLRRIVVVVNGEAPLDLSSGGHVARWTVPLTPDGGPPVRSAPGQSF